MWRSLLLMTGWLIASLALYGAVLGLELYWNFFDWLPRFDLTGGGLMTAALVALTGCWFLARAPSERGVRIESLVLSLALLGLGVYVLPAETRTEGLFARQLPSPWWYRGGRLALMCCPVIFWARAVLTFRRKGSATYPD